MQETKTALIVDDDDQLLRLYSEYVGLLGYHAITAGNVIDALSIMQQSVHIQVVITDYNLPDKTGGELLKFVKGQNKGIITVIVTGNIKDVERSPHVAFADFIIEKPMPIDALKFLHI